MLTLTTSVILLIFVCVLGVTTQQFSDFFDENEFEYGLKEEAVEGILLQVSMVTRHGQRTPKNPYPADPYRDPSNWPEGWLQLTAEGARQHERLGNWTRKRYADFIPETYRTSEISIRSTGISRALASAFAFSTALFPGQAIPIHSAESKRDRLFFPHKSCPAYNDEQNRYLKLPLTVEEDKKRKPLYKWLTSKMGRKVESLDAIEGLYSLLTIERQMGLNPPSWTDLVYPQPLKNLTGVHFSQDSATPLLARLRHGNLLKDILNHASHAGGKKSTTKFRLYSAHDFTIIGLLNCMGLFDGIPCGFASSLIFEMRKGDKKHGNKIDIFYRNDSVVEPKKLIVEKCGDPCYVKKLMEILEKILPENIDEECQKPRPVVCSTGNISDEMSILLVTALGSAAIGAILVIFCAKVFNCESGQSWRLYQPNLSFRHKQEYTKIPGNDIGPTKTIRV